MNTFHVLLALLVPFIWGVQAVMLKFGISEFPPIFMVAFRFFIMSIILLPFIKRIKGKVIAATFIGLTQGVIHFSLLYIGFQYSDVTSGMIVYQLNTIFTLVLASIVLGEYLTKTLYLGTFVCIVGIALIIGMPQEQTSISGLIIIASSALMFAVGNILIRKFGPFDPIGLNSYVSLIAFPSLLMLSFILEDGQVDSVMNASFEAWGALFYTAIIGGILAFFIWYWLLNAYSVNKVSPYGLLMPFFSMIASILILDENVTTSNYVGAMITVVGISIVQYGGVIFDNLKRRLITLKK